MDVSDRPKVYKNISIAEANDLASIGVTVQYKWRDGYWVDYRKGWLLPLNLCEHDERSFSFRVQVDE